LKGEEIRTINKDLGDMFQDLLLSRVAARHGMAVQSVPSTQISLANVYDEPHMLGRMRFCISTQTFERSFSTTFPDTDERTKKYILTH
jgi:hypothetical protein